MTDVGQVRMAGPTSKVIEPPTRCGRKQSVALRWCVIFRRWRGVARPPRWSTP